MASKKSKNEPGTKIVPITANKAIAASAPDYLKSYRGSFGTENIGSEDVAIPRLKLAQSLTPAVKDGEMEDGSIYLNVTGEVVAEPGKPVDLVMIVYAKEFILWRPRKDNGGGILARAKPVIENGQTRYKWDKPNTEFTVKVEGKTSVKWKTANYIDEDGLDAWGSEIPGNKDSGIAATAHYNYVVALPEHDGMVAAFSLSRSQAKKAKDLNAMLKMGNAPIFARQFTVQTTDETNGNGDQYKNLSFKPAGFVPDEASFKKYRDVHEGFRQKGFTVDQSDEANDED